jgi:hypothetical protein
MNLLCMCTLDIIIGFFKFSVSLLLNSLSFQQLLNHFLLKNFHQRNLCFFLSDYFFLLRYHFSNFYPCTIKFLFSKLFNFCTLNSLLLFLISILQFFFLFFLIILYSKSVGASISLRQTTNFPI